MMPNEMLDARSKNSGLESKMMELETSEFDRIVREVVRRLGGLAGDALDVGRGERATSAETMPADTMTNTVPADTTLCIEQRIVTARLLEGRLKGIRSLRVGKDAVVTPLVKDMLRESSIELTRDRGERQPARTAGYLLVESMGESTCGAAHLVRQLAEQGTAWREISTWRQLLAEFRVDGTRAAVCTSQWAARVCQANRAPDVRAVHVADVDELRDALQQIDANLLVIDATRVTKTATISMLTCFARSTWSQSARPTKPSGMAER